MLHNLDPLAPHMMSFQMELENLLHHAWQTIGLHDLMQPKHPSAHEGQAARVPDALPCNSGTAPLAVDWLPMSTSWLGPALAMHEVPAYAAHNISQADEQHDCC